MPRLIQGLILVATVLTSSATSNAVTTYTMVHLGTLPGWGNTNVNDVNNLGQALVNGGNGQSALYENGSLTPLTGYDYINANSINDNGQIVGFASLRVGPTLENRGFVYSGGAYTTLPGTSASAFANNNAGQIAGYVGSRAVRWENGNVNDLAAGIATDINEAGDTVGYGPAWFRLSGDSAPTYFLPDGGAYGINQSRQVVGNFGTTGGRRAFLYQAGNLQNLGTLPGGSESTASDINDLGQIVGSSTITGGLQMATIYTDGQMFNLNTLLVPPSPWRLTRAASINNLGQIAAVGTNGNEFRSFLLTPGPVPEPGCIAWIACLLLFRRAYRSNPSELQQTGLS